MDTILQWLRERLPSSATTAGSSKHGQQRQQHQQQPYQDMLLADSLASKLENLPSLLPAQLFRPHAQQHTLPIQTSPAVEAGTGSVSCNMPTQTSSHSSNLANSAVSSRCPRSSRKASQNSSSNWRQQLTRVADKLSCKVVLDSNSGSCATELCWHVRTEQQPAKLAVKLSNRHQTRVSFDAQVALRPCPSKCPMLRLAGTPHGIHSASLLIKPLRSAPSPSMLLDGAPNADSSAPRASFASSNGSSSSSNQYSSNSSNGVGNETSITAKRGGRRQRQRQGVNDAATASSAPTAAHRLASSLDEANGKTEHRPQQQQQQHQQPQPAAADNASAGRRQPATADAAVLQGAQGSSSATTAAGSAVAAAAAPVPQVQWEVGWNWKVGGPVAAVTKQLDTANSSSGSSSTARPLAVQQLKAAYDPKSCSYTVATGGAGWSVNVVVPTQVKGFGGLVPRVWQAGCRPKVTVSLVPELTCF